MEELKLEKLKLAIAQWTEEHPTATRRILFIVGLGGGIADRILHLHPELKMNEATLVIAGVACLLLPFHGFDKKKEAWSKMVLGYMLIPMMSLYVGLALGEVFHRPAEQLLAFSTVEAMAALILVIYSYWDVGHMSRTERDHQTIQASEVVFSELQKYILGIVSLHGAQILWDELRCCLLILGRSSGDGPYRKDIRGIADDEKLGPVALDVVALLEANNYPKSLVAAFKEECLGHEQFVIEMFSEEGGEASDAEASEPIEGGQGRVRQSRRKRRRRGLNK